MADITLMTFAIAGGFAALAIGRRGIQELTRWHSDRVAAASAGRERFEKLCDEITDDPNAPEEVVQLAIFLSDRVGSGHLAKSALAALQKDVRKDVEHLLEFLPYDLSDEYGKKLVALVRAALAASVPMTWKPQENAATIRRTKDVVLVAAVLGCLDC